MIATALSADPNDAEAHFVKGELLTYARKQFAAAVAELKVAIENDRNFAPAYAQYGANHWFIGKAAEVIPDIETALRLSPRDPMRNIWELFICHAHMHLAEWEQAVEWCEKSIATRATYWQAYVDLAAGGATRAMSEFRKRAAILAADSLACLGLAKRMSGDPYYVEGISECNVGFREWPTATEWRLWANPKRSFRRGRVARCNRTLSEGNATAAVTYSQTGRWSSSRSSCRQRSSPSRALRRAPYPNDRTGTCGRTPIPARRRSGGR